MSQPVLTTPRLRLEPLTDAHLDLEISLDSDAEVLRYIWGRSRTAAEVREAHLSRLADARPVPGLGFWMAFTHDNDCVGLMMLFPAPGPDKTLIPGAAELGYRVARAHWRKGYAEEAARELVRHAFETVNAERVLAHAMTVNVASRALMAKLGMRHTCTSYDNVDIDRDPPGKEEGEVEYEITRKEWVDAQSREHADDRSAA